MICSRRPLLEILLLLLPLLLLSRLDSFVTSVVNGFDAPLLACTASARTQSGRCMRAERWASGQK